MTMNEVVLDMKNVHKKVNNDNVVSSQEPQLYLYESEQRYYKIILQRDLFGDWSVMRIYGGRYSKRGGSKMDNHLTYEEAISKIKLVDKQRRKRGYKLVNNIS